MFRRSCIFAVLASWVAVTSVRTLAEDPKAPPSPEVQLRLSSPEDGEQVPARSTFRLGFRGEGLAEARFKIVLEREGSPPRVVEQSASPASWYLYRDKENPGAGWRPDEPLADGVYTWHGSVLHKGVWVDSDTGRFTVDSVPPARVEGVRFRRNPDKGTILVEWDPVTLDKNGAKESEIKYRLYRYEPRPFFYGMLLNELALTLDPRWEDRDPKAVHAPMLFYLVRAVDAAWNESEVKLP